MYIKFKTSITSEILIFDFKIIIDALEKWKNKLIGDCGSKSFIF